MTKSKAGNIVVTISVHEEDGVFQAECLELGVPSLGRTLDEAFQRACEATLLYLNTIEAEGQRDRIFRDQGIKVITGKVPSTKRNLSARPEEFLSRQILPVAAIG